jgi:hypothetical protein
LEITQADGVVRYTPIKDASSDPYFYPLYNNTQVTGKYLVIKYRLVNDGVNMTTSALFASSLASGQACAAGSNGDNANTALNGATLYADGEWHYLIITPTDGNTTFTPNADGTYTWRYLRMRLNNFKAFDRSCYFEIDEIAFADNLEAVENYAYKPETKPVHTINLDLKNNTVDGNYILGNNGKVQSSTIEIDLKDTTLNTSTSLALGGWVSTPGGIKSYVYRVTSVDGVKVEDPTEIAWTSAETANDVYKATGVGKYTEAASKNARFNKTKIDLSAYVGHTVVVEVVANTNYGVELVLVRVTNVKVTDNATLVVDAKGHANDAQKNASGNDEDGTTYTRYTAVKAQTEGNNYVFAYADGTQVTGKYIIIRYRADKDTVDSSKFHVFAASANTEGGWWRGSQGSKGEIIDDGEWHLAVIELADNTDFQKDETTGEYTLSFIRLGWTSVEISEGVFTHMDIDYIAFADSQENVDAFLADNQ